MIVIESQDGALVPVTDAITVDTKGNLAGARVMMGKVLLGKYRSDGEAATALRCIKCQLLSGRTLVEASTYAEGVTPDEHR